MRGKEFLRIPDALQNPGKLAGVSDRKYIPLSIDRVTGVAYEVRTIFHEPLHIPKKFGMRVQILPINHLNGIERDQANHGAQAEFIEISVGQPKHVVKETVLL